MRKWPAQVSTVVANVGRELSLLKMAINMANADYPSFFLWNELEPRCQQRAAGSLELHATLNWHTLKTYFISSKRLISRCYIDLPYIHGPSSITWSFYIYFEYNVCFEVIQRIKFSNAICNVSESNPVNSPHKWPVTRKMFPFDDVIMTRPFSRQLRGIPLSQQSAGCLLHYTKYGILTGPKFFRIYSLTCSCRVSWSYELASSSTSKTPSGVRFSKRNLLHAWQTNSSPK